MITIDSCCRKSVCTQGGVLARMRQQKNRSETVSMACCAKILSAAVCLVALAGCVGSLGRDEVAAKAKTKMIGMTREDVLSCMGPPRKKASENKTEVWSYLSTDKRSSTSGGKMDVSPYSHYGSTRSSSFCTVNVVMKDGGVSAVHYLGPMASSFYNSADQCGYAVEACAE